MSTCAPFERSAEVYDIIHAGKKYDDEARRILHYLEPARTLTPFEPRLIDLGCGTGEFTRRFAHNGWQAIGVDISEPMIQRAQAKGVCATIGSIGDLPFREEVEAVTCLYGAFCYITAAHNQESILQRTFQAVRGNLRRRGLFVFDVLHTACCASRLTPLWDGTFASTEDETQSVRRVMSKRFDVSRSIVYHDIRYTYKGEEWTEQHAMRSFSVPEIKYALFRGGFRPVVVTPTFDNDPFVPTAWIDESTYYISIVAEAL